MKINDEKLRQLLAAAAGDQPAADTELPPRLETRILAQWRASRAAGEPADLVRLLQFGLGFACIVTLLIAAISLHNIRQERADQITMPNAAINLALSR